jgi:hypothetical protein
VEERMLILERDSKRCAKKNVKNFGVILGVRRAYFMNSKIEPGLLSFEK